MAGSIDPADYDAPATYGGQHKMKAALKQLLGEKDPAGTRQRKAKSSNARGQLGVLRLAATENPLLVLKALAEPLRLQRKRQMGRDRQRRRRDRLRREAAAARN